MTEANRTTLGALIVLFAALLACDTTPSALPYPRLGIQASDSYGTPVSTVAANACVLLPVLRGSRIDHTFTVATTLALAVSANRDGVVVDFQNANPPVAKLHLSRDQLKSGYSEQFDLKDESGTSYVVLLSSDCPSDAKTY